MTRRTSLLTSYSFLSASLFLKPKPSNAGLVQFPCNYNLMNTYHFMRAGESLLESQDILSTNPLFLTNRDDALSDLGREQVQAACNDMLEHDVNPSVLKYSLASKSIDTANIIANEMLVGRNRLIPEYTFMDPRAVGLWDMEKISVMEEAIWAMDHDEAGKHGDNGRPPPTDDSTPNETLSNQVIRLRQLMSVLETQFSGDTILLVFPDGTSPALLMCLMAGIPLNRVHEFNFNPGEVRYDVKMDMILSSAHSFTTTTTINNNNDEKYSHYVAAIERGREKLKKAREVPIEVVDVKEEGTDYHAPPMIRTHAHDMEKEASLSQKLSLLGFPLLGLITKKLTPDDDNLQEEEEDSSLSVSKSTNVRNDGIEDAPELKRMQELIVKAPFDIPELNMDNHQKDEISNEEKEEKIELANEAMTEYLNQDDGEEDWLGLMDEIMHEE